MISKQKRYGGSSADLISLSQDKPVPTESPTLAPKFRLTEDLQQRKSGTVVLHEQVICYCSSFDLHASEWNNISENIKTLSKRMHLNLGKWPYLIVISFA